MKKLLFLPLVLISCLCFAQDAKEIIGKPFKIGNLLVAENDFPIEMKWEDAKKACTRLGAGWRLPTKNELNILFKDRERIGNFFIVLDPKNEYGNLYYSSSEGGSHHGDILVWIQDFNNGKQIDVMKNDYYRIRAVRKATIVSK
jgi:hypothetical protein